MFFFLFSLLLIAVGLTGAVLLNTVLLQTISVLVCLLGVSMLIAHYRRRYDALVMKKNNLKKQLLRQQQDQETHQSQTEKELEQLRHNLERIQTSIPVITSNLPIENRLEALRSLCLDDKKDNEYGKDYRRLFAELEHAVKNQTMLKDINKNFTSPLMEKLEQTALPLAEEDKKELTARLLQLALIAIDYTQEYRSTHNGSDSLALRVATGAAKPEEAAALAKRATSNVYETEKTLRVLWNLVTDLGCSDALLIVHDTLLQSKQ